MDRINCYFSVVHSKRLERSLVALITVSQSFKSVSHRSRCLVSSELKHATFLSHGRQPEVNISQSRTLVSPRFST